MASWNDGYVTDVQYTSGFYREMTPAYLRFVCDIIGVRFPRGNRPMTYAELGCGQGMGTNIMAASNQDWMFHGFDFNPAQIANAREIADEAGLTNVRFHEASFEELAGAPDEALPRFDIIALHGIISWVMPEHFQQIITFVRRTLNPGGLVYVSYNCLPGWTAMAPLRHLLRKQGDQVQGRSDQRLQTAFAFANRLKESGARYFGNNPVVGQRMEKLATKPANYLAHEYFNQAWELYYFDEVAKELERAKLDFAGSASLLENFPQFCYPEALRPLMAEIQDPILAQTVHDFAVDQQFRRDIFVRGHNALLAGEQTARLYETRMQLVTAIPEFPLKFKLLIGEAEGKEAIYKPLLTALAQKPLTLREASVLPEFAGKPLNELTQAFALLAAQGIVHPAPEKPAREFAVAQAFNRIIARRCLLGKDYQFLSAPAVASGVAAGFFSMAALTVLSGKTAKTRTAAELAEAIWQAMEPLGRRLTKEGNTLQSREESLPELERLATEFLEKEYPYWKSLGIL